VLQCVAACCSVLQCVATCCSVSPFFAGFCNALHSCDDMGWLQLVGSIKLQVSFTKEPNKRDNILQKRPII